MTPMTKKVMKRHRVVTLHARDGKAFPLDLFRMIFKTDDPCVIYNNGSNAMLAALYAEELTAIKLAFGDYIVTTITIDEYLAGLASEQL